MNLSEQPERIRFENISMSFDIHGGVLDVVEDVSLGIRQGEFVSLVGPSGCGKTTMLSMAAGFVRPTSGKVLLDGRPITGPGPDRGVMFQDYGIFPWLTVEDNVAFGLRLAANRKPAAERARMVERYLRLMGLWDFRGAWPRTLSGGMRQRLALARAYAVHPEFLLMDEPFGALDAQTRQVMGSELLRMWEDDRKTIIFVTHDLDEAIYLADRIIVMSASPGRVIREIPVHLSRPRDLDIRNTLEFLEYRRTIWSLLEQEVRTAGAWHRGVPIPATT